MSESRLVATITGPGGLVGEVRTRLRMDFALATYASYKELKELCRERELECTMKVETVVSAIEAVALFQERQCSS